MQSFVLATVSVTVSLGAKPAQAEGKNARRLDTVTLLHICFWITLPTQSRWLKVATRQICICQSGSVSLSVSVRHCLCVSLSVHVSLCVSLWVCLCECANTELHLSLSFHLALFLSVSIVNSLFLFSTAMTATVRFSRLSLFTQL